MDGRPQQSNDALRHSLHLYRTDRQKKRSCICWRACRVGVWLIITPCVSSATLLPLTIPITADISQGFRLHVQAPVHSQYPLLPPPEHKHLKPNLVDAEARTGPSTVSSFVRLAGCACGRGAAVHHHQYCTCVRHRLSPFLLVLIRQ